MFSPKGLFFSKNNERAVVYTDNGAISRKEVFVSDRTATIYKRNQSDKFLIVQTYGLTADEMFSLVINPVIQQ
jgi:hypothetical protein